MGLPSLTDLTSVGGLGKENDVLMQAKDPKLVAM
jgi:hypothetical protein